jgi:hypothetical protein
MPDTASKPRVGPWYYLYLRPRWRLCADPVCLEEETLGHPKFWKRLVAEFLAPHYGIKSAKKIALLEEICYGMPRGRCSQWIERRGLGSWTLYHGSDFPSKLKPEAERMKLLNIFGLRGNEVKVIVDDHEMMQSDDQRRLQEIIGPIPY